MAHGRGQVRLLRSLSPYIEGLAKAQSGEVSVLPLYMVRALTDSDTRFPLSEEICRLTPADELPTYIGQNPILDISAAVTNPAQKKEYARVDISQEWPPAPTDSLDSTQWEALKEILTK